jgi:hypothetical protein
MQNTCNNAPFAFLGKRISRKAASVFRHVRVLLHIEPGPVFRNAKLPIIFANIRV